MNDNFIVCYHHWDIAFWTWLIQGWLFRIQNHPLNPFLSLSTRMRTCRKYQKIWFKPFGFWGSHGPCLFFLRNQDLRMESKVVEVTLKQGELIVYLGTSNWWGNKQTSQTIIDHFFLGQPNPLQTQPKCRTQKSKYCRCSP